MRNSNPIMLVDDDRLDAITLQRAFAELGIPNDLIHMTNGQTAMEYLQCQDNEEPCIILLDLNMPQMGGTEFLKLIKAEDELRKIPVIVMCTSNYEEDVAETFKLGAAGYILKTVDYKKFLETVNIIDQYWALCNLPTESTIELPSI